MLIAAQVVVSIVTLIVGKKKPKDGEETLAGLGDLIGKIIAGVIATLPLGALGFGLIVTGLVVGGYIDPKALFSDPTETPAAIAL